MSQDKVETLRAVLERYAHGDFSPIGALGTQPIELTWERAVRERHALCRQVPNGREKLLTDGVGKLMPFVDRIAVRTLVFFAVTLALEKVLAITIVALKLFTDGAIPGGRPTRSSGR